LDDMYHLCASHMNRRVRIHTRDGECHEGVIVHVDCNNVYLRTSGGVRTSGKATTSAWGWGFGSANEILTLSLFTLLAIALI
jgi:small nuclear ribonucleoprotein (snRNP)-like protein